MEAKCSKQCCCSTVAAAVVYSRCICSGAVMQHAVTYTTRLARGCILQSTKLRYSFL